MYTGVTEVSSPWPVNVLEVIRVLVHAGLLHSLYRSMAGVCRRMVPCLASVASE